MTAAAAPPETVGCAQAPAAGGRGPAREATLEAALLAAHAADDRPALARLYAEAARLRAEAGDEDGEAFFLTTSYIFALEVGAPEAAERRARLVALGRDG